MKFLLKFKKIGLIRAFREEIEDRIDDYKAKHPLKIRSKRSNPTIGGH